jgi:hypothetical protein
MPTAITSGIADGMTFPEFIRRCARSFGAFITMRDDPMDAPFPEKIEPDISYYTTSLSQDKKRLAKLKKMSPDEIAAAAKKEYDKNIASYKGYITKTTELKEKYIKILFDVHKWVPPTPDHINLKNFMIEQLTTSIEHDCNNAYYESRIKELKKLSPKKWHAQEIKMIEDSIKYDQKHIKSEIERAAERTKWIQDLIKSLPPLEGKNN